MKNIITVFVKEIRDILRDKRSRSAMLIGPFISITLTFVLFGIIGISIKGAKSTKIQVVASKDPNAKSEVFLEALKKAGVTIEEIPSRAEGEARIKSGKARLVLDLGNGIESTLKSNQQAKIVALFDESDQKADIALSVVEKIAQTINEQTVKKVFVDKGVDPTFSTPIAVERTKVKVGDTESSGILTQILPYLIVVWAFYGGFGVASDIVAGEKERQTLETLLISPVKRSEFALGKLLALFVAGLTSAIMCILAVFVMTTIKPPGTAEILGKGLGLTAMGGLSMVAVLIPTVLLFASGLLAISSFSKNTRESQTYLAQASFLVIMPAMFSQIIGFTDADKARWVSFIPVLNTANTIREALSGKYDWVGILITIVVGFVLSGLALAYAIRLFNREEVLTRI